MYGNCIRYAISNSDNYFKNKLNVCFVILLVTMILVYFFTIISIIFSIIDTDNNGIEIYRDGLLLLDIFGYQSGL